MKEDETYEIKLADSRNGAFGTLFMIAFKEVVKDSIKEEDSDLIPSPSTIACATRLLAEAALKELEDWKDKQ